MAPVLSAGSGVLASAGATAQAGRSTAGTGTATSARAGAGAASATSGLGAITAGVGAGPVTPVAGGPGPGIAGAGPATGMLGTAGAADTTTGSGMAPPAGMGDPSACPPPPPGASDEAVTALMAVNESRVAAGSGCMNMQPELNMSALNHCQYNAMNAGMAMCMAGGHNEVMACAGFTGTDVAAREKAAGYSAVGATEVLTSFGNMPAMAVPGWINTVWHRIPMLDPWTTDMGYGGAQGCDVIDFGRGATGAPADTVVVWPYDGQTDVPPSFSGREAPVPPAPPAGWPSGYPVNVYAQKLNVTEHVLTKDGDSTPLPHVWMDFNSSNVDPGYKYYLINTAFLYANAPLEPNTKYRVKITGTSNAGPLNLEWTFTTGAANPWGF